MKKAKYLIAAGVTACLTAAAFVHKKLSSRRQAPSETAEEKFLREWTTALQESAGTFNGLFSGLDRVAEGVAKKPEKTFREWCQRSHYKFEDQPVDILCRDILLPLVEAEDRDRLVKWAKLLLEAASAAGIVREETANLVLNEKTACDYIEWDGKELYCDDEVEVLSPAWYQNGELLEQGMCKADGTN